MHAYKTPDGWTARKPNSEGTAWESVTLDGNEQAKLDTLFATITAAILEYTSAVTLISFDVYTVDVSSDPVTFKSGIVNFLLHDAHQQHRF